MKNNERTHGTARLPYISHIQINNKTHAKWKDWQSMLQVAKLWKATISIPIGIIFVYLVLLSGQKRSSFEIQDRFVYAYRQKRVHHWTQSIDA